MAEVWYTTRERVKAAVDVKNSVRANQQIDRAIADGSRSAEKLCRRVFHPRVATQTFDWPDEDRPTPWRIWLGGQAELVELLGVSAGGSTIALTSVKRYPTYGPPYTRIELDRSRVAGFGAQSTPQQAVSLTALFGYSDTAAPAGTLAEALDDSETQIDVTDGSVVGVGSLLRCGDERMIVTERSALTTGVTITAGIAAQANVITLPLSSAVNAPVPGEMILVDGERMLVQETVGTSCYVSRMADGTVLAAHLSGATVYAYRTLTVARGAVGTTAATHLTAAALTSYQPPSSVEGYVVAYALNQIAQENSGYARVVGSGDGQREARGAGLSAKRAQLRTEFGRRVRMGAV